MHSSTRLLSHVTPSVPSFHPATLYAREVLERCKADFKQYRQFQSMPWQSLFVLGIADRGDYGKLTCDADSFWTP
jgi:hypothetical protein